MLDEAKRALGFTEMIRPVKQALETGDHDKCFRIAITYKCEQAHPKNGEPFLQ